MILFVFYRSSLGSAACQSALRFVWAVAPITSVLPFQDEAVELISFIISKFHLHIIY